MRPAGMVRPPRHPLGATRAAGFFRIFQKFGPRGVTLPLILTNTRQLGFLHSNGFLKAGEPREFFGLAHMNEHRTAVLTHYYALESASAGRGFHKTAFFHHSTPRCAIARRALLLSTKEDNQ